MMQVVRAGSGVLLPFVAGDEIRFLVAITLEDGDLPAGTLLSPDVHVSADAAKELGLSNPAKALSLGMQATGEACAGIIRCGADRFLQQFTELLRIALNILNGTAGDEHSRADRVRAREQLAVLGEWATMATVLRSGGDAAAPLDVPLIITQTAVELARIGRRLRHHERETSLTQGAAQIATNRSTDSQTTEEDREARGPVDDRERIARRLPDDRARIVTQTYDVLIKDTRTWIPSRDLAGVGLSNRTVHEHKGSMTLGVDFRGGGSAPLEYGRSWLLRFLVERWSPRGRRRPTDPEVPDGPDPSDRGG